MRIQMRNSDARLLVLAVVVSTLSPACGQKGPLYLPEEPDKKKPKTSQFTYRTPCCDYRGLL